MTVTAAAKRRLKAALVSLALLPSDATFDTDDDTMYIEVAGTILEELDEVGVNFSQDMTPATLDAAIKRVLQTLGHAHAPNERVNTLSLLCTELQLARLQCARTSSPTVRSADSRLADGVSRLAISLSVSADDVGDLHALRDLLSRLHVALQERVRNANPCALGMPLHTGEVDEMRLNELNKIAETLDAEYRLRREMLLQRLSVTVRAFARKGPSFQGVLHRVCNARVQDVSVADALAARDWMLQVQPISQSRAAGAVPSGVKDVLMGDVPDRGGRVGVAAAAVGEMPRFSTRVDFGQASRGGRKGKWKGKGKKGKR